TWSSRHALPTFIFPTGVHKGLTVQPQQAAANIYNHWTPDVIASPRPSRWPVSCLGTPAHVNSTLSLLCKFGHGMRGASGSLSSRRAAVGLGSDEFGSPVV
ncbi:hypothetical protein AZE42_02361, partial [Rhizopogon vesiculosus]